MADTGVINIRGKEYQTVALRVSKFREAHPTHSLTTTIVNMNGDVVIMQAQIADETGSIKATGHAEEYRASSQINKTSALENCETSAIGRALAAFGFGGSEFASANEVVNAIHQQNAPANDAPPANDANERVNNPVPHEKKAKAPPLAGPYTSKSALWTAVRKFAHELNGCGDSDMLEAFLADKDSVALLAQCERDAPNLLRDSDIEDYVPLDDLIAKMRRDFDLIENNTLRAG